MIITIKPSEPSLGFFIFIDHSTNKNTIHLNELTFHVVKRSNTKTNWRLEREWRDGHEDDFTSYFTTSDFNGDWFV